MNSKYKNLVSNTAIFAIGNFGSRLITFFLVPLYTNILTREQYGTADLVITCANMIVPVISIVIQDSVLRFILSKKYNEHEIMKCSFIVMAAGTIFALLLTPIFRFYPAVAEWRLYLLVTCLSTMLNNVMLSYTKAVEKNKLYATVSMINAIILCGCNIIFLSFCKLEIKGYLLSNIIAHVASSLILILCTGAFTGIIKAKFNQVLMKQMLLYSAPLIANNVSWWILNSSDRVMIEYFCSASELGLYTAAAKIPAFLSIITTIFSQAWSVSAIKEYDNQKEKKFYSNVFKSFSFIMFVSCSIIVLLTKPLMSVYVGKEFYESWKYVPLLVVGAVYYSFSSFFGAIYGAVKKNISVAYTTIVAAIINISINLILMRTIGVYAAVISTAVSYFVVGVYRMIHSQKFFSFEIDYKRYAANTIIVFLQAILLTLDKYTLIISILSLLLLLCLNFQQIKDSSHMIKNLLHRH